LEETHRRLFTIIARHHPEATRAEIVAELRGQAAIALAEAEALDRYGAA
jgi:hypothetical protein